MVLCGNRQCTLVWEGRQAVVGVLNFTNSARQSALTMCVAFCYLRGKVSADGRRWTQMDAGMSL